MSKQRVEESVARIVKKVAYTKTSLNVAGKVATLTTAEAVMRSIVASAAKGNTRAGRDFLAFLERAERSEQAKQEREKLAQEEKYKELVRAFMEYKVSCKKKVAKCCAKGRPPPAFFPDPDHIHIDPRAGAVRIFGPMAEEELPHWEVVWGLLAQADERIAGLTAKLDRARTEGARKAIRAEMMIIQQIEEKVRERSEWLVLPP